MTFNVEIDTGNIYTPIPVEQPIIKSHLPLQLRAGRGFTRETVMTTTTQTISSFHFLKNPWKPQTILRPMSRTIRAAASVRSLNRKPLQKGRNLSIEAIQTVQALKLAYNNDKSLLDQIFRSKFSRLLKFDMTAVLRELLRQNHCLLALKVKYYLFVCFII